MEPRKTKISQTNHIRQIKNLIANFVGTGLVGVINIFSLSLYVRYFGMGHWGYVSTYIAIMNVMMMLDLGISQIYISEFHKEDAEKDLFARFQSTLVAIASLGCILAVGIFVLMNAMHSGLPVVYGKFDLLFLALALFAVNIINNFYYTNLVAQERQVEQNIRLVSFMFLKNVAVIILINSVSNAPETYFCGFLPVSLFELWLNSKTAPTMDFRRSFRMNTFMRIIKKCSGLSLAIGVGILVFNLDRLVLPSMISPQAFGVYAIVVTIGLYALQLQYPIIKAILPFTARSIHIDGRDPTKLMLLQSFLLFTFTLLPILLGGIFAKEILKFYSVPAPLLEQASFLFDGVLIAVLINAAYNGIYLRLMIEGKDKVIILINVTALLVALIIFLRLGSALPFLAGAVAWVSVSAIQLAGGCVFYISMRNRVPK